MGNSHGTAMRRAVARRDITPFIGVYDAFSASLAARRFDALFISGFGFAASHYGLPDIGFIAWSDMVAFVQRVRTILPAHHLLVDIDDGYCDTETACHVTSLLESIGASGVILEDQKRPRRCGHFGGKQLMELESFLEKLGQVLSTRRDLFIVARTDATDREDRLRRAEAFAAAGADAVLVDGLEDIEVLRELSARVACPLMFNQIAGGKSPPYTLTQLKAAGVSMVNYSTPCLFAAQGAIEGALLSLGANDGLLPTPADNAVGVAECTAVLRENLNRRDNRPRVKGVATRNQGRSVLPKAGAGRRRG